MLARSTDSLTCNSFEHARAVIFLRAVVNLGRGLPPDAGDSDPMLARSADTLTCNSPEHAQPVIT